MRVPPSPFEQTRSRDRDPYVFGGARLQPAQQAIRRGDRPAPEQPSRDEQSRGRRAFAFRKGRRVAQRPPAVGASAAPEPVTSEGQPVRGIPTGPVTVQPPP